MVVMKERLKEKDVVDDVEEAKNGRRDSDKNTYEISSIQKFLEINVWFFDMKLKIVYDRQTLLETLKDC